MELALKRIQSVKSLLTVAEDMIGYDREEAYKILDITEVIIKRAKKELAEDSCCFLESSELQGKQEVQGKQDVQGKQESSQSTSDHKELTSDTVQQSITVEELEHMFAETRPPRDDSSTVTSGASRRNFTCWAKTLNLPSGHPIYFGDVTFKLSYDKKNRATLTTQIRTGKTIIGYSPSGVIKTYLNSIGSAQKNVNGWKRLEMDFVQEGESAERKEIGSPEWLLMEWNADKSVFNREIRIS